MLKSDLRNEECCLVIDAHQTGFWKLAWVNGPVVLNLSRANRRQRRRWQLSRHPELYNISFDRKRSEFLSITHNSWWVIERSSRRLL